MGLAGLLMGISTPIVVAQPAEEQPSTPPTVHNEPIDIHKKGSIRLAITLHPENPDNPDTPEKPYEGVGVTVKALDLGDAEKIRAVADYLGVNPDELNITGSIEDNKNNTAIIDMFVHNANRLKNLPENIFTVDIATTPTDSNGKALFTELDPNIYMVKAVEEDKPPVSDGYIDDIRETAFVPIPVMKDAKAIYNLSLTPRDFTLNNELTVSDKSVNNGGIANYMFTTDVPDSPRLNKFIVRSVAGSQETIPDLRSVRVKTTGRDDAPLTFSTFDDIRVTGEGNTIDVFFTDKGLEKLSHKKPEEQLTVQWSAKLAESDTDGDDNVEQKMATIVNLSNGNPDTDIVRESNPVVTKLFAIDIKQDGDQAGVYQIYECNLVTEKKIPSSQISVNGVSQWEIPAGETVTVRGLANKSFYNNAPAEPTSKYCIKQVTDTSQPGDTDINDADYVVQEDTATRTDASVRGLWPAFLTGVATIIGVVVFHKRRRK